MPYRTDTCAPDGPTPGCPLPGWALVALAAAVAAWNVTDVIKVHHVGVVIRGPDVSPPQWGRVLVNPWVDTLVQAPTGPVDIPLDDVECGVPAVTPYTYEKGSIKVVATICDLQAFQLATRKSNPVEELRKRVQDLTQEVFTRACPKMGIYDPLKNDTGPFVDAIIARVEGTPGVCKVSVPKLGRPVNRGNVDETVRDAAEVLAKQELAKAEKEMTEKVAETLLANLTLTARAKAEAAKIELEAETNATRARSNAKADALRAVGAAEAETTAAKVSAKVAAVGTDPSIATAALATEALENAKAVHVVSSGINVYPHAL